MSLTDHIALNSQEGSAVWDYISRHFVACEFRRGFRLSHNTQLRDCQRTDSQNAPEQYLGHIFFSIGINLIQHASVQTISSSGEKVHGFLNLCWAVFLQLFGNDSYPKECTLRMALKLWNSHLTYSLRCSRYARLAESSSTLTLMNWRTSSLTWPSTYKSNCMWGKLDSTRGITSGKSRLTRTD